MRVGVNSLKLLQPEAQEAATDFDLVEAVELLERGAPVVRPSAFEKIKGPGAEDFSNDSEAFYWSGRQDLNLRPLGPEPSALPG